MRALLPTMVCLGLSTALAQSPQYSTFAGGCPGSMPASRLLLLDPPRAGATLRVDIDNLPSSMAFMLTGLSNTTSSLGPLPLALAAYGLPGCSAHVSPDAVVFVLGTAGHAIYTLAIPPAPGLVGAAFFQQALVIDPGAGNAAGAVVSEAKAAVIGAALLPVPSMVAVSPGSFLMGSTAGPAQEQPEHTVTISQPFWIGRYEVTQAEYEAVMGYNPSAYWWRPSHPVDTVSWDEAMAYCAALTAQEAAEGRLPAGYQYRLPTEAEWEYCCRAGTTTEFHVGNSLSCGNANFMPSPGSPCWNGSRYVGSYPPNPWGLRDMHGNVFEWCLDSWDGLPNYPTCSVVDPYVTSGPYRVLRGGYFGGPATLCRSANRVGGYGPTYYDYSIGFRIVLAPVPAPVVTMVAIVPGSFPMGSTQGYPEERPVHTVHITQPFWMSKHEVTQGEYQAVMGTNPSFFRGSDLPVERVTWINAMAYCAALTAREAAAGRLPTGYQYRLPTEAEWEYCCRAGTTTEWNTGTSLSITQANMGWFGHTTLVGICYAPNPWGLHDMHGNVYEWCLDSWDGSANYPAGAVTDPYVSSGPGRVFRGGSWIDGPSQCRSAFRAGDFPSNSYEILGFRVVLGPILVP